jgi:NADPH2:quinone reductase
MPHVIRVERTGGPEVLQWVEVATPVPAAGEVLIRQTAVGLNFVDIYQRSGLYPLPLPFTPGNEGVGVVEAIGPGVSGFKAGDRVVYTGAAGAYAQVRVVPAAKLIHLPAGIDDRVAAASFLKGTTVQFLLQRTFKVGPGHTILFHAAAGGVGLIATQWAKALGATVIGTVGSEEKKAVALKHGCDHVINYRSENFVDRVKEITGGAGVDVVYDAVGKDTFPGSLDCLRPLGTWVSFGNASGVVPPFSIMLLQQKGSLFATRAGSAYYLAKREDLENAAKALFAVIADGSVKAEVSQTFALKDAGAAQAALESRKTIGATVLLP